VPLDHLGGEVRHRGTRGCCGSCQQERQNL